MLQFNFKIDAVGKSSEIQKTETTATHGYAGGCPQEVPNGDAL